MKRKPRRHLTAADMPRLRDELTEQADEIRRNSDQIAKNVGDQAIDDITLDAVCAAVRDAELWWVRRDMVELAASAAVSMIEWTPSLCRPGRAGILYWDHGSGVENLWQGTAGTRVETMAVLWFTLADGVAIVTVSRDPIRVGEFAFDGSLFTVDEHGKADWEDPAAQRLWDLVGATWLLAQQPTIGHTWGVRYDRRDPDRPFARPTLPSRITVVTLREISRAAGGDDPGIEDPPTQPRKLTHRHLVRGHWRQQACGPERRWRKPVFVLPHVKGPEGTELVMKPAVRVWRR